MAMYVVTGAAGFVGSHLSGYLLDLGHRVRGIDSFADYYSRETKDANLATVSGHDGFSFLECDLAESPILELVDDADGIFHLAAQPGVRGSWGKTFSHYARDNVIATQRIFEAAVRRRLRVVWASSSSVYGNAETYPTPESVRPNPISPYGVTKLCCEHLAGAYAASRGLDHVALRYFTVYGPRQRPDMAFARVVRSLADGASFTVFGTGEQTRDVTYVADAVAATVAAMDNGRSAGIYNVGGGSETSLRQAISICERLCGRALDVRHEQVAAGDVYRTAADTRLAFGDLDWEPQVSLEQGLRQQLAWGFEVVGGPADRLAGLATSTP
jgi:nucleoside-diphosphate-sugar epimerase